MNRWEFAIGEKYARVYFAGPYFSIFLHVYETSILQELLLFINTYGLDLIDSYRK